MIKTEGNFFISSLCFGIADRTISLLLLQERRPSNRTFDTVTVWESIFFTVTFGREGLLMIEPPADVSSFLPRDTVVVGSERELVTGTIFFCTVFTHTVADMPPFPASLVGLTSFLRILTASIDEVLMPLELLNFL